MTSQALLDKIAAKHHKLALKALENENEDLFDFHFEVGREAQRQLNDLTAEGRQMTEKERMVLKAIQDVTKPGQDGSIGGDFCNLEDVTDYTGLATNAAKGVIGSLMAKSLILIEDYEDGDKPETFYYVRTAE